MTTTVGVEGGAPGLASNPSAITDNRMRTFWSKMEERYGKLQATGRPLRPLAIRLPNGSERVFGGNAPPVCVVDLKSEAAFEAFSSMDELSIGEAFMAGDISATGDVLELFKLRDVMTDRHPLQYVWSNYVRPKLFGQVKGDIEFIGSHYDEPPEFFELWLDKDIRSYSHGFFESDDEAIEVGMKRKFQYALDAIGARPGDRVLDIGGGWGSFVQYAGEKGIHVHSVTISDESVAYIRKVIAGRGLSNCKVDKVHLLDFSAKPFDGIVNLGVTEHLPDYKRTIAKYCELLAPGGRIYLDAYSGDKFGMSTFVMKWVFQSKTSPLCLPDYLKEVERSSLELLHVQSDRHNYFLSCKKWAENLDAHREEITARWGEFLWRRFHLYLWSSAFAFQDGILGAHRLVLEHSKDPHGRTMRNPNGQRRRLV